MRAAGEAVRSIFDEEGTAPGTVEIHASEDDSRSVNRISGSRYLEREVAGWTIAISEQVFEKLNDARVAAAPNETGGIVVGTWDRRIRKGYLVALLDPPPDSIATPTGFVRGALGVFHKLEAIGEATAQNLNYVGEWHTHPPRATSTPSDDDRLLMRWINDEVTISDVPAIMLIGGDDGIRLCVGTTSNSRLLSPTSLSEDDQAPNGCSQ
jgi:integrative and conjugative element protein (TIGR02256 family)